MLVAIAIPVFTTQLERSREATDLANVRSAYAAVVTGYLDDGSSHETTVTAQQKVDSWNHESGVLNEMVNGSMAQITVPVEGAKNGGSWTISIDTAGDVTITGA